jgi:hypothetical protein
MFLHKGWFCYFVPTSQDGDFVSDKQGNEYQVHESGEHTEYIIVDNQSWLITYK